jgi:hypothetical protein
MSRTERDGAGRFHHVTQNGAQFETYELFISGIFHFTESTDAGVLMYSELNSSNDLWHFSYVE